MSWRLFLDDVRDVDWIYPDAKDGDYIVCRSYHAAVEMCQERGCPSFVSFDHDLGESLPTGLDFANWLVIQDVESGFMPADFRWHVHSANPWGAANIEARMKGYFTYRNKDRSP